MLLLWGAQITLVNNCSFPITVKGQTPCDRRHGDVIGTVATGDKMLVAGACVRVCE